MFGQTYGLTTHFLLSSLVGLVTIVQFNTDRKLAAYSYDLLAINCVKLFMLVNVCVTTLIILCICRVNFCMKRRMRLQFNIFIKIINNMMNAP